MIITKPRKKSMAPIRLVCCIERLILLTKFRDGCILRPICGRVLEKVRGHLPRDIRWRSPRRASPPRAYGVAYETYPGLLTRQTPRLSLHQLPPITRS